jgi:hypothetical protein
MIFPLSHPFAAMVGDLHRVVGVAALQHAGAE